MLIFLGAFIAGLIVYSFTWPLKKRYNLLTPKGVLKILYEELIE
jgi:uncharacterized membrane protein